MSSPRHPCAIGSRSWQAKALAYIVAGWCCAVGSALCAAQVPMLLEEALYPIPISADEPLQLQAPNNVLSAASLVLLLKQSNSSQQVRISGAEIVGTLDLQRAEIPAEVILEGCVFRSPVTLDYSWFHHALVCKSCVFQDVVSANFAKIDADLNLSESSFWSGVTLSGSQIAHDLVLKGAHFQGSKQLDLSKTSVGADMDAREATFGTGAYWDHLQVKGLLTISRARFTDAFLDNIQIGEDLVGAYTVVERWLSMTYADGRGVYFTNCIFGQGVSITAANIRRHLSFQNSTVIGPLIADQTQIAYDLDLRASSINHPGETKTAADDTALSQQSTPSPNQQSAPSPNRPRTPSLDLTGIKAGGITRLNDAKIQGIISLAAAELQILSVTNLQHSASGPQEVWLTRTGVHEFEISDKVEKTAKTVTKFLDHAAYDPGIYNQFNTFLRAQGDYDDADNVFVDSQIRNREENLRHDWVAYVRSWLWYAFTGYGHLIWLSLVWSAVVVVIGMVVFRKRSNMALREEKLQNLDYSPFWFSLDVFAPIIDLEAARVWEPRPEKHLLWNWLRIQRILGWILVPLALVAITGALQFPG